MRAVGIVGSEAAKFTPRTEALARQKIRELIAPFDCVVSGGCHLGGIDIWAKEEAKSLGKMFIEHLPEALTWTGGYKERNLLIVDDSDEVYCVTVKELPPGYEGMKFVSCYHCKTDSHVKSGGCWTVKKAKIKKKKTGVIVIE